MNKAQLSRREFLQRVPRTPAAIVIFTLLAAVVGGLLWYARAVAFQFVTMTLVVCLVVFIAGLLPMTVGFIAQFFVRKQISNAALWLIAIAFVGIQAVIDSLSGANLVVQAPAWLPLMFLGIYTCVLFSFLSNGASLCRRWLPKRLEAAPA